MMNNKASRYFLYARKSSEAEDRQVASTGDQITELKPLAERYNIRIVDIITESKSAKEPGREKFNEMLKRIRRGEADGILCWKINRLARNAIDGGQVIHMLQSGIIQHIQCYSGSYSPGDNLVPLYVEFGVANQFIKDQSQDVRRGLRNKALRGWNPSPTLPLGYSHVPTRKTTGTIEGITLDPEIKRGLRMLWDMVLSGERSLANLFRKASDIGLRPNSGKPINYKYMTRIFWNEFYCGYFYWKDESGVRVRIKGQHESVVSETEFHRACSILENKSSVNFSAVNVDHSFRGMFTCGTCNHAITGERKNRSYCRSCHRKFSLIKSQRCPGCGLHVDEMKSPTIYKRTYYGCGKARKECATSAWISEECLSEQLLQELDSLQVTEQFSEFFINALEMSSGEKRPNNRDTMRLIERRTDELYNRRQAFITMRADGELSRDEFLRQTEQVERRIRNLKMRIASIRYSEEACDDTLKKWVIAMIDLPNAFVKAPNEEKRMMIKLLCPDPMIIGKKLVLSYPLALRAIRDLFEEYQRIIRQSESRNILKDSEIKGNNYSPLLDRHRIPLWCARVQKIRRLFLANFPENTDID